jgi:hypothetical protein
MRDDLLIYFWNKENPEANKPKKEKKLNVIKMKCKAKMEKKFNNANEV